MKKILIVLTLVMLSGLPAMADSEGCGGYVLYKTPYGNELGKMELIIDATIDEINAPKVVNIKTKSGYVVEKAYPKDEEASDARTKIQDGANINIEGCGKWEGESTIEKAYYKCEKWRWAPLLTEKIIKSQYETVEFKSHPFVRTVVLGKFGKKGT